MADEQVQFWCRLTQLPGNRYGWAVGKDCEVVESGETGSFRKALSNRSKAMSRLFDACAEAYG